MIINHDLRCVDGKTIYNLPEVGGSTLQGNLALPNVYEQSATALYQIGTKFVDGERVFHYAYAGEEMEMTLRAKVGYDAVEQQSQATYDTSQAAGVGTVASPFKIDGESDGTPAANAWAGMYILIYSTTALGRVTMRIASHTKAVADDPWTIECVLDQPTPHAIAANTTCDIFPSRYADVRMPTLTLVAGNYPFLGVNLIPITTGNYFWLQTWGPCFLTTYQTQPGDTPYDRTVTFQNDGTIEPADHDFGSRSNQIAGYTLATSGSASEWIMLMCDR